MKIASGATRVVILYKNKSIKIGKVRPLRTLSKLISLMFSTERAERLKEEYGETLFVALWNFLFVGIWANNNEFAHYQKHHDPRVAPTNQIFLFGLVAIQERGLPVTTEELSERHPFSEDLISKRDSDLREARQYGQYPDGRIRLVDYGGAETCKILSESLRV